MKKNLLICLLSLLFINNYVKSQDIVIPTSSPEQLLCKKWVIDYAIIGNQKMGAPASEKDMYYDFKKNNTFVFTMGGVKKPFSGTWKYDPSKKVIQITIRGEVALNIISLSKSELIMVLIKKTGSPMDDMKTVYIVSKS